MLSKTEILDAVDCAFEKVAVPKWGGDIFVREMTGTAREAWERIAFPGEGESAGEDNQFRAKLLVFTLCDEAGNLLFDISHVASLAGKNAATLVSVYTVASRMNGLRKSDEEDAAKNS